MDIFKSTSLKISSHVPHNVGHWRALSGAYCVVSPHTLDGSMDRYFTAVAWTTHQSRGFDCTRRHAHRAAIGCRAAVDVAALYFELIWVCPCECLTACLKHLCIFLNDASKHMITLSLVMRALTIRRLSVQIFRHTAIHLSCQKRRLCLHHIRKKGKHSFCMKQWRLVWCSSPGARLAIVLAYAWCSRLLWILHQYFTPMEVSGRPHPYFWAVSLCRHAWRMASPTSRCLLTSPYFHQKDAPFFIFQSVNPQQQQLLWRASREAAVWRCRLPL